MRTLIRNSKELEEFVTDIFADDKVHYIACDTETQEFSDDLRCPTQMGLYWIGIYAGEKHQCYIIHNGAIDYEPLNLLFEQYPTVFHNAKFDLQILISQKIISNEDCFKELHDTLLLSFIDDEEKNRHWLKYLAHDILKIKDEDIVKYKDITKKPTLKWVGTLFEGTMDENLAQETKEWEEKIGDYCMDDCKNTYKLFKHFQKSVNDQDQALRRVYMELCIPFMKVLTGMELRGVCLDLAYLKEMELKVEDKLVELGANIWRTAGRQFDINSSQQLSKILFEELKYKLTDEFKTPKGTPSVDAKALAYLVKTYDSELCKQILEYRELAKLQSTYIKWMPKLAIDGVVHTSFNQIGTVTWRLSSNAPNLQNIPRRDDEFNIRKAFVARPGYVFLDSDFSQLELRIMAFFSQDPKLLETYQNWGDIHKMTADTIGCTRNVAKCFDGDCLFERFRRDWDTVTCLGIHPIKNVVPQVNEGKHTTYDLQWLMIRTPEGVQEVVSTYYERSSERIEIELENGDKIKVTPDHWCVVIRDGNEIEIKAEEVLETDEFIMI